VQIWAETVWGGLGGLAGRVQGSSGQDFSNSCGCGAGLKFEGGESGADKKFQSEQNSSVNM